jgi:probable phosphoglycerate mutase
MAVDLWLIRHGETEWSLSGAHTGRTDLPLTAKGEEQARGLRKVLTAHRFGLVLTSPMQRARKTCELAGLGDPAKTDPNLMEWDYGSYEGKSTAEIQAVRPGWSLFRDGVPSGETIEQVAARAKTVIARALTESTGDVAMFAHGHLLRILAACWMGIAPNAAQHLVLGTASISTLGYEHESKAITRWNLQE